MKKTGIIKDLQELKPFQIMMAVVAFMAVISPGFLLLYLYHPEMIRDYDVIKLLIFSAALTLPVFIAHATVVSRFAAEKETMSSCALAGGLSCSIAFYLSLFLAYYFCLSFKHFCLALVILSVVCVIAAVHAVVEEGPIGKPVKKKAKKKTS